MNPAHRTLQITVECRESPAGSLDMLLGEIGVMARNRLEDQVTAGSLQSPSFDYEILGSAEEEQAVVMATDITPLESNDLDDLVHEQADNLASRISNLGVEGQVRWLCRELGTDQVLQAIENERNR